VISHEVYLELLLHAYRFDINFYGTSDINFYYLVNFVFHLYV